MLSILIPAYNYNCIKLVNKLHSQAKQLDIAFEIIVIDDHSTLIFSENKSISLMDNCIYVELPQNIGRAKIRNLLATKAHYNHFLFIDCDAEVITDNYLQRYIYFCQEEAVVCGGCAYDEKNSNPAYQLRLQYGLKREARNAQQRQQQPYSAFSSFNFLISKSIFEKIKFNENLSEYGHEDTLFGFNLQELKAPIYHIENALLHAGLEDTDVFIEKTKQGINNLLLIEKQQQTNTAITKEIKLLTVYKQVERFGLKRIFSTIYTKWSHRLESKLGKAKPNLLLFDLYKLTYICKAGSESDKLSA